MAIPRIKACAYVSGDTWDPAALTALLGIEPSSARMKGENGAGPDGWLIPPATEWIYEVEKRETYETEEVLAEVLEPFTGKQEQFSSFVRKNQLSAGVDCVIEIYGEKPIFEASASRSRLSRAFPHELVSISTSSRSPRLCEQKTPRRFAPWRFSWAL